MASRAEPSAAESRVGWLVWGGAAIAAAVALFYDGIVFMFEEWDSPEYSHGYLIPFIALYLVWQKRRDLLALSPRGAWTGALVVTGALIMGLLGNYGTIYVVIQYAFLAAIVGVVLAMLGWSGLWLVWVPLAYLAFMVPLPDFLYGRINAELQLISSQWGVAVIRFVGISVFLDGNIIDLGTYKLQVVEACSGLRYLFPLMSFGFLCAYLFQGRFWQRAVIFLSTIPITVLMNSFRIGVIGVLVDAYGIEMAEGFLHFFEGWIIFIAGLAVMFGEMWLMVRFARPRRSILGALALESPAPDPASRRLARQPFPWAGRAAVGLLALSAVAVPIIGDREEATLARQSFGDFPLELNGWQGQHQPLEPEVLEALRLDDYISAGFIRADLPSSVHFFVAYYNSQRKGQAVHSPQSCIPGGGWRISEITQYHPQGLDIGSVPFVLNRALIEKGSQRQLVYYWFPQRDRHLTNEFLVKWYLFVDGVTRNRTDGSLVRLVTQVGEQETLEAADRRLTDFLIDIWPQLPVFLPIGQAT